MANIYIEILMNFKTELDFLRESIFKHVSSNTKIDQKMIGNETKIEIVQEMMKKSLENWSKNGPKAS